MKQTQSKLINWDLPQGYAHGVFSEDFKGSMERYLVQGLQPGGFTTAMLAHDLERALYNADTHNRTIFWQIAMWVRYNVPEQVQGSYNAVEAWCRDIDGCRSKFQEKYEKEKVWLTLVK